MRGEAVRGTAWTAGVETGLGAEVGVESVASSAGAELLPACYGAHGDHQSSGGLRVGTYLGRVNPGCPSNMRSEDTPVVPDL